MGTHTRITWWRKLVNSVYNINFVMDPGRSPPYFGGGIRLTTNVCSRLCNARAAMTCKIKKSNLQGSQLT
ncbi:hypothetical protein J15TS10_08490 [Paenibacillus woosongensis]|uniref:Uncharacterized protein n=1 Tax=Paenibacillus woosongensis TaxID=307580 RepID=A0ABQ4MM13_9BACL|nr:hypothetical protein J15TS10_08490 [Paenibacillus woosongensis]